MVINAEMGFSDMLEAMREIKGDSWVIFGIGCKPHGLGCIFTTVLERCIQQTFADAFAMMTWLNIKCCDFYFRTAGYRCFARRRNPNEPVDSLLVVTDNDELIGV